MPPPLWKVSLPGDVTSYQLTGKSSFVSSPHAGMTISSRSALAGRHRDVSRRPVNDRDRGPEVRLAGQPDAAAAEQ